MRGWGSWVIVGALMTHGIGKKICAASEKACVDEPSAYSERHGRGNGPYPPIFPKLLDPSLRPDPYLPDSAQAILAAKGWRDSDGDRFLDRDGRRFRFTLLTPGQRTVRT